MCFVNSNVATNENCHIQRNDQVHFCFLILYSFVLKQCTDVLYWDRSKRVRLYFQVRNYSLEQDTLEADCKQTGDPI